MNYAQTLQAVDTLKALSLLGMGTNLEGSYVYYKCHKCQGKAVAKAYGEKKNLIYCTKCKTSGHIIGLVQEVKAVDYNRAKELLKNATSTMQRPTELKITYELKYHKFLEDLGLKQETCEELHIGVPKGKTMLAGCVAFEVKHEGKPIAYYGLRMKDLRPVFHRSFNPEINLYTLGESKDVILTTDLFEAVRNYQKGRTAICNFYLPYLAPEQIKLLNQCERITFNVPPDYRKEFALQCFEPLKTYYRFI
jgi:hypothetical protein